MVSNRRIVIRMPRLQVYLPDDLYRQLKAKGLPASELLQTAVRAELERQRALEATDEYLEELMSEVGEPTSDEVARAAAIVRKIRDRSLGRAV
jgi:post-segregation antitoxin (ccd killing protein)